MAEITYTRAEIRRSVARQLRMRFAQRMGDSATLDGGTTAIAHDASLAQSADFWNGAYFYAVDGDAAGDVRRISDFAVGTITPEFAFSGNLDTDTYEIHDLWSANDIHRAINRAIESGWPSFFDQVVDETLVVQEDTEEYDLTGLSTTHYMILQIWMERNSTVIRGTATAGAASTITDSSKDFSGLTTDYQVSIYDGTGKGQVRAVSSGTAGGVITVGAAWDTNPDTTSKYAVWDASEQLYDWRKIMAARFDQMEFPEKLYLTRRYPAFYGMRLRLLYVAKPSQLTTDAGTTMVPDEYIIPKALSILHDSMVNDNRSDRQRHAALAEYHDQLARAYMQDRAFRMPSGTLWQERDESPHYRTTDLADPLAWEKR